MFINDQWHATGITHNTIIVFYGHVWFGGVCFFTRRSSIENVGGWYFHISRKCVVFSRIQKMWGCAFPRSSRPRVMTASRRLDHHRTRTRSHFYLLHWRVSSARQSISITYAAIGVFTYRHFATTAARNFRQNQTQQWQHHDFAGPDGSICIARSPRI